MACKCLQAAYSLRQYYQWRGIHGMWLFNEAMANLKPVKYRSKSTIKLYTIGVIKTRHRSSIDQPYGGVYDML